MPSEPGLIESINAVTIVTANMATAVSFYDAFGFVRASGTETSPFVTYRVGAGFLNLQLDAANAPVTQTWGRIIFFVADVDAMHEHVVGLGIVPLTEPWDAPWGERYFHVRDPDGHELSFARPIST